jgi:hypothetical protein
MMMVVNELRNFKEKSDKKIKKRCPNKLFIFYQFNSSILFFDIAIFQDNIMVTLIKMAKWIDQVNFCI